MKIALCHSLFCCWNHAFYFHHSSRMPAPYSTGQTTIPIIIFRTVHTIYGHFCVYWNIFDQILCIFAIYFFIVVHWSIFKMLCQRFTRFYVQKSHNIGTYYFIKRIFCVKFLNLQVTKIFIGKSRQTRKQSLLTKMQIKKNVIFFLIIHSKYSCLYPSKWK